jgi:TetR/AcrR family transcriptional regulator, cholesterol catabolism regulator
VVQVLNISSVRPRGARVQQRNEARRLDILRAAARVFRRHGIAAAGMREIAEEAGLSSGNLYHYFSGKDEILLFCQERSLERMLAAASSANGPAAERLRAVLRAHVHSMLDGMEGTTAHLDVEALPARMRARMIERRDAYERAVRGIVADGMQRGEFARGDAALVTRAMLGAVNWTARWYRPDGPQGVDEIADGLAEYLVKGLG